MVPERKDMLGEKGHEDPLNEPMRPELNNLSNQTNKGTAAYNLRPRQTTSPYQCTHG